jgi:hypothetical protein
MASRKLLKVAGALALVALGGCAAYPYDNYAYQQDGRYYQDGQYYYRDGAPYYAPYPGYYAGPSIGFGITYSDRDYYRHRHYH